MAGPRWLSSATAGGRARPRHRRVSSALERGPCAAQDLPTCKAPGVLFYMMLGLFSLRPIFTAPFMLTLDAHNSPPCCVCPPRSYDGSDGRQLVLFRDQPPAQGGLPQRTPPHIAAPPPPITGEAPYIRTRQPTELPVAAPPRLPTAPPPGGSDDRPPGFSAAHAADAGAAAEGTARGGAAS